MRPLTTEDWELMEMHSEVMEFGGWLEQVSLVYPKQELTLRVGGVGRDCVHLIVVEAIGRDNRVKKNIGDSTKSTSVWPVSSKALPNAPGRDDDEVPCMLLLQDTEVVVEPKPRPSKKVVSWSAPLRLIPSHSDWSQSLSNTVSRMSNFSDEYLPLVVDVGCILVSTDAWPFQTNWARIRPESETNNIHERVVRVVRSTRVSMDDAGTLKMFLFRYS